jgi:hypothetical protein
MKKATYLLMFLLFAATTFCQQTTTVTPTLTKQDYLLKSKRQNIAGWVLLSGGFLTTSIGAAIGIADAGEDLTNGLVTLFTLGTVVPVDEKNNSGVSTVLLVTGLGTMLGGISLLSAATKNKRAGAKLSFGTQKIPSLQNNNFTNHPVPSLSLKIGL